MKLLVFAHTPPPLHGQSYMVQLMLDGFGGDRRARRTRSNPTAPGPKIECYHVNVRLSKTLEDIGEFHGSKLLLLVLYCFQAVWCRFRHGVTNLYYIPAPGKRSALYRDWLVMFICRPFFKRIILHWHAAGLAKWLETVVLIRSRALTYRALKEADMSIVLSNYNRPDAEKLLARNIRVVGNGITDPCPDFEETQRPWLQARYIARQRLLAGEAPTTEELKAAGDDPHYFKVLFLAHCTREKGLFDTIDAVALANATLAERHSPLRLTLTVAGEFVNPAERIEFDQRLTQPDLKIPVSLLGLNATGTRCCVEHIGFVTGEKKQRAFARSDCFCFPTYYYAESFGLVVLEGMAFGLPVVASHWRSIPELFPTGALGLVPPRHPRRLAEALLEAIPLKPALELREHFLRHYTVDQHLNRLADAILSVERESSAV